MIKKEILQDLDGDDLTPPSYLTMTHLPPSAPLGPEAALMPNPGPGEVLPGASTGHPTHDKVMWKRTVKQGFRTRGAP